jgi:lipopolysaccharide export LptBFGC system permease protein LptF
VNRRATAVLLATFGAALAVMLWLVAEMRTAAATSGPPPPAPAAR